LEHFFSLLFLFEAAYSGVSALNGCLGTDALVARLSHHLHGRIAAVLPTLRRRVAALLQDASDERRSLGEEVPSHEVKRRCLDELTNFSQRLKDELEGSVDVLDAASSATADGSNSNDLGAGAGSEYMSGVAAITHLFDEQFAGSIAAIDALDGLSDAYIRRVIDNSNTLPPSLFVPEKAFHALVKEQIARLEQPGIMCVEMVHERLLAIVKRCIRRQLGGAGGSGGGGGGGGAGRFPVLAHRIEDLVARELAPMLENCKAKVCV
jgi:dynamin 1-like protein